MKRVLRLLLLLIIRAWGWPGVLKATRRARKRSVKAPRILLVRPDHLGDVILTTPLLQVLKDHTADARITLLVGPWSSEIVARHPAVDRLLTCAFPGFRRAPQHTLAPYILLFRMARQLRRDKYDLAINLRPDFWWGAALLYLAGIPRRVGYTLSPGRSFLNLVLPFQEGEHAAVSNLRLTNAALVALGYDPISLPFTPQHYPACFTPTSEERAWVEQLLNDEDIPDGTPLIVIAPGSGGAVKLWRSQAWAACANMLRETLTSPQPARILLTGSPGERALVEEVARGIPEGAILVTHASIGQLAALLARASCVLTVDNGPGHLAVAQDTPSVHLFGPTDPHVFGPWGDPTRHRVLASRQRCPACPTIPCGRLDWTPAELPEHPCVRVIDEQRVLEVAKQVLNLKQAQEQKL